MATSAMTHTISSSVKPSSPTLLIPGARHGVEREVGGGAAAALLPVRSQRDNVEGAVLARRAIDVGIVPGIVGNVAALQIGTVPGCNAGRGLDQRRQPLGRRGVAAGVEIEQVERAGKTLHLDLRGL